MPEFPDPSASGRDAVPDGRTVDSVRRAIVDRLRAAGVPSPEADAELLLGHVLGVSRGRVHVLALTGAALTEEAEAELAGLVERRAAREPLQHLTGIAPFRGLDLAVGPGVFVPRPETETVAQVAIDALRAVPDPEPIAVDLGTGSGALALALAAEVPHARVVAVERSAEAHAWASENQRRTSLPVRIVLGDFADCLPELDGTVSVVVSNPPYIPDDAVPRDPEVRLHDPEAALYGGPDGLDVVRILSRTALRLLRPGGVLVLEHGEQQGPSVRELLVADGWRAPATVPDPTGRPRATAAIRP